MTILIAVKMTFATDLLTYMEEDIALDESMYTRSFLICLSTVISAYRLTLPKN